MRYLGIDWGLKKIGLALSEGELASPYKTLEVQGLQDAKNQIINVLEDEIIDLIIIGKPEGISADLAKSGLKALKEEGFEVKFADETLSTKDAKTMMMEMGLSQKKRRDDNSVSAAIILQRWLDEK
jgi:putative Holliday junction resolvase